ncbi:hypothetical protein [Blastococcus sp. CT_GayMR19]|uniref:SCO7613 C-terminal domain-containing membrane protein n=1 Tax=Blastococcus sp. CT_GayMR19 TaxID=2559608 RepID=UPI00142F5FD0|nr:hypothetical protein [Blastococcus sp. CT_GayMR19]
MGRRPVLLYWAKPFQVLLAVGAVLLVSAGVAVASAYGGAPLRWLLLVVAAAAAVCSVLAAWAGLRSSEEILAVSAAGLVIAGSDLGGPVLEGDPGTPAVLAVVFLALHHRRLAPTTAVWPLASWAALQLAVLRALDSVPDQLRTATCLAVALVGLGIALSGRPLVARVALLTAAPWWLVGVFRGSTSAWTASGAERWLAAGLMIAAAFGLLVARLREELDPLLGPPRVVPVVAGLVAGAATAGAFSSLGALATTLTGYAGVLLATLSAAYLTGWRRGLLLPVALTAGIVMTLLCVVQLVAAERWSQLCLLLLLTALPTVVVAVRHPEDQPVAVPTAVGCLAGAILLALPDGLLTPVAAAMWLTALYGAAMAVGSRLDPPSRLATARAAAVCAVAAAVLLRAQGEQGPLAAVLLALGAFTLLWAWRTRRRPRAAGLPSVAWRVGAGQLVLGLWVAGAALDITQVEWYSLTAAVGLLIAAGPKLLRGASGPAWGPGLLTAAVPSALIAVVRPDAGRAVGVILVAALAMVIASRTGVRAPLVIGAATELWIAFGFTVRALPWPLATALVVGALLAAQGMRRERRPVPFYGTRLAALR